MATKSRVVLFADRRSNNRSPVLLTAEAKEKAKIPEETLSTRDFSKPFSTG